MNNRKRVMSKLLLRDVRNLKKDYKEIVKGRVNAETLKPLLLKIDRINGVTHKINANAPSLPAPAKDYDYAYILNHPLPTLH